LPVSASVRFSSFQDSNSGPSAGATEVPQTACFFELFRPEDRNPDRRGLPFRAFPPRRAEIFRSRALLLFLTSRPSALRTRGSRCPAASGRYSLRGSVPCARPKPGAGRCSHGLSRLIESWFCACGRAGCPTRPVVSYDRSGPKASAITVSREFPHGGSDSPLRVCRWTL